MTRRGRPKHDDILTPREWEVLQLIEQGLTNEQIAAKLDISFGGAKFHVAEILSKLGVDSREEAVRVARERRRGLLPPVPVPAWLKPPTPTAASRPQPAHSRASPRQPPWLSCSSPRP